MTIIPSVIMKNTQRIVSVVSLFPAKLPLHEKVVCDLSISGDLVDYVVAAEGHVR